MNKFLLCALVALALTSCGKVPPTASSESATPAGKQVANRPAQYGTPFGQVPPTRDAVIYQVNIRAFSAGGNFAGVQARLDAIEALGANVLYLLPTYPVGELKSVGSPYCVKDYLGVNSEFGTLADLRTLVAEAHIRGMAVLLDWVADHTSLDHPWISNKSWYLQDGAGNIISPPKTGWTDVAALDYANTDMREAMIEAMKYWVYEANIDGYRCDAADFIPADFWKQAIDALRAIPGHRLLLLAEGTRKDHFTAGFDLKYAMGFYSNLVNRVYGHKAPVKDIDLVNRAEYVNASADNQVVRYTSNHDVDLSDGTPLDTLGGQHGSMAAFVVAAYMKGVPMVYDGQEVGCPVRLSYFNHSTVIDWNLRPEMIAEYTKLLGFRNHSKAIKEGELRSFSDADVCVFTKTTGVETVLVVVNLRNDAVSYTIPKELEDIVWRNAFGENRIRFAGKLDLQPFQYQVFQRLAE